jgi:RNA polymerase sigma factor (sigma-70 family)
LNYSEAEILEGFLRREETALAALHARLYAPLCYFADKMTQQSLAAEDAVTEVFVKTWRSKVIFLTYDHLRNYLYEAVKNECLNYVKAEARNARRLEEYAAILNKLKNDELEATALEIIFEIAEGLPAECKRVFDLLYKQQMDYQTVADQLNLSVQTVRNQRTRAVAFIRKQLKLRSLLWLLIFLPPS